MRKKPLSDGTFPIYLRITQNRKAKFIYLNYSCKTNQWNEKEGVFKKNYDNYVKRNIILSDAKKKALQIIDQFVEQDREFTLNQFEELFRGKKTRDKQKFYEFFESKINDLAAGGRTGNQKVYQETLNSFRKFIKVRNPDFEDITPRLLEKYEIHLRSNGGTDGGISVKMRTIRAVYNDAIKRGMVKQEHYPFRVFEISKLKGKGQKRALSREEFLLIADFPSEEHSHLRDARNYFVFSYYTRGMNFVDMMKLRWTNIINETILYRRSKTNSNFQVKILPPVQAILDYYKAHFPETNYVSPILLQENLKPNQIENRKKKTLKKFNKDLKEIGKIVGIQQKLTSYVARHSFATNLKQAGIATAIISESMGHKTQEVTENYLKEFENKVIDDAMETLYQSNKKKDKE